MPRGIDHLVIAVRDLDAARAAYQRLGFTLTPEARHPFGTKNSLVQLDGAFLELVAVADPALIPEPTAQRFSFAAFNRDFLARREGLSMLVLRSRDANLDHAAFATRGLRVFEPGPLRTNRPGPRRQRTAGRLHDDLHRRQAPPRGRLLHLPAPLPGEFLAAGLSTPRQRRAERIEAAVMVARDPADFHEFLTHFTGVHDMVSTSLGIEIDTGAGKVAVLSPVAYQRLLRR